MYVGPAGALSWIVMFTVVFVLLVAFVPVTMKSAATDGVVGVPLTTPVAALMLSRAGSPEADQV